MFFLCFVLWRFIKYSWGNFRKEWNKEMLQVVVITLRIMQHFTAALHAASLSHLSESASVLWPSLVAMLPMVPKLEPGPGWE